MYSFKSLLPLVLTLCFVSLASQKRFNITGTLKGFEENALVKIESENIILDSCYLKNGKFQLMGTLQESPTNVYLAIKSGKEYKYSFLFIGNENITINAKKEDFPFDIVANGSKYNTLNYENSQSEKKLMLARKKLEQEIYSLEDANKWNDSLQIAYWGKNEHLGKITTIDKQLEIQRDIFIDKHFNSHYGLYLLETYKTAIPKEKLQFYYDNLSENLKKTATAKSIQSHLINPDLKIGDNYYNFSGYDKAGRKRKFSDFFDNKFVLLDFSTLYCGFCIEAIPQLEKFKKSLREKLEIVTFYVDKSKNGFEGLSKKHNENWNILWDKEGRLSDTYAKYKVFGTPMFYLFDQNGKLVYLFDGFSEDMPEQLENLIK